jgi:hypothetical protein
MVQQLSYHLEQQLQLLLMKQQRVLLVKQLKTMQPLEEQSSMVVMKHQLLSLLTMALMSSHQLSQEMDMEQKEKMHQMIQLLVQM